MKNIIINMSKILLKLGFIWLYINIFLFSLGTIVLTKGVVPLGLGILYVESYLDFGVCNLAEYQIGTYYLTHDQPQKALKIFLNLNKRTFVCNKYKVINNLANIYFYEGFNKLEDLPNEINFIKNKWEQALLLYKKAYNKKKHEKSKENIEIVLRDLERLKQSKSNSSGSSSSNSENDKNQNKNEEKASDEDIERVVKYQKEAYKEKSKEKSRSEYFKSGGVDFKQGW